MKTYTFRKVDEGCDRYENSEGGAPDGEYIAVEDVARLLANYRNLIESVNELVAMCELDPEHRPGTDLFTVTEVARLVSSDSQSALKFADGETPT
jgi:hypothetical protein